MIRYYSCLALLFALPLTAQAVDMDKLSEMMNDPEQMQQAAEKMAGSFAEAAGCTSGETFQKIQAEGQAVAEKIKALCEKGDRRGAERAAAEYSKKVMASDEFKKLEECSEKLMAGLPQPLAEKGRVEAGNPGSAGEQPSGHICDM